MKQLLENQERHLTQAARQRDEHGSEINNMKSEVEQSNKILQAASEVAGQRDAVAHQLSAAHQESQEMKGRIWKLEDDLYKTFTKNANLELEVENFKNTWSDGIHGWEQDTAPTAIGVDGSAHGTADARSVNPSLDKVLENLTNCLLYTSPSPRDRSLSRMPSSA